MFQTVLSESLSWDHTCSPAAELCSTGTRHLPPRWNRSNNGTQLHTKWNYDELFKLDYQNYDEYQSNCNLILSFCGISGNLSLLEFYLLFSSSSLSSTCKSPPLAISLPIEWRDCFWNVIGTFHSACYMACPNGQAI